MRTRVLDRHAGLLGQQLNRLRALAQQVEQLNALRARDRVTDAGELSVQRVFEFSVTQVVLACLF
jgi:hypothetical protein